MTDAETRLNRFLPAILEKLDCEKDRRDDVREFLLWLCHEFPEYKKSHDQAPTKASLHDDLEAATNHAAELTKLLSNPLLRGAVHRQAYIEERAAHGEGSALSMHSIMQWERHARTLARHLDAALKAMGPTGKGGHKKLGGRLPRHWIIEESAHLFNDIRREKATATNTDFLAMTNIVWTVVSGEDGVDLADTAKRVMPEIKHWEATMTEAAAVAERYLALNKAKHGSQ